MRYLILSFLFVQTTYGVLPPLWQSSKEIKAILDDPQFGTSLQSGEVILKIKRSKDGWLIVTNKNHLPVRVVPQPQDQPGPEKFTLEFGKVSPHE